MTTEAEHIAGIFEHFAKDHDPTGYPAVQQKLLSEAAATRVQTLEEVVDAVKEYPVYERAIRALIGK